MQNELDYTATLTSDSFLYYELKQVLKLKKHGLTDDEIRKTILENNMFQYKSKKSAYRLFSSVMRRVKILDNYLIDAIINEPMEVGKIVNLYAIMKTNKLFFEFMNEVIREKLSYNYEVLEKQDINIFFTHKSEQSVTVARWSETTVKKLKQVIIKILYEVGIVESIKTGKLSRLIIPPEIKEHLIGLGDKIYIQAMGENVE